MGRTIQQLELVLGGVILSGGLAIAAIYASHMDFIGVFTGFSLFIIGYEISQYSVYRSEQSELRAFIQDILESSELRDLFMAVTGLGMVTYGFVLLFSSVEQAQLWLAITASLLMFGGYMVAHYGINGTVV